MGRFKYFELEEFIRSDVAKTNGIDNTPTFEVVDHLEELIEKILDPMRAVWGSAITVTSGYRSPKLNSLLAGASDSSVHPLGWAADLVPKNGNMEGFIKFVPEWLRVRGVHFDQCLIERKGLKRWVHIGLYNAHGQQRGQIKMLNINA